MNKNKILICASLFLSFNSFAASDMMQSLFDSTPETVQKAEVSTSQVTSAATASGGSFLPKNQKVAQNVENIPDLTLLNFETGKKETFQPLELTAEKAKEFVPPIEKSQMIYADFIDNGKQPYIALMMTYMFLESELEESGQIQ